MFPHTCQVWRQPRNRSGVAETLGDPVQEFGSLRCLIEPMDAETKQTLIGDGSFLACTFSWGTEVLKQGDEIRFAGRKWELRIGLLDNLRPAEESIIEPYGLGHIVEKI